MGHADGDAVEAGRSEIGDRAAGGLGSTSVSGPGQNALGERLPIETRQGPRRGQIGHVHDQRIERGRPLAS